MSINNEPFHICSDVSQLAFIGTGIPLYFQFIIACGYMFLVTLLVFCIYATATNSSGETCINVEIKNTCYLNYFS